MLADPPLREMGLKKVRRQTRCARDATDERHDQKTVLVRDRFPRLIFPRL